MAEYVHIKSTICRTVYCEECAKKDRLSKGQKFVTFGSSRNGYRVNTCDEYVRKDKKGYTPHILQYLDTVRKTENGKEVRYVRYKTFCAVDGCGIKIKEVGDSYEFTVLKMETKEMLRSDYTALQEQPDLGYNVNYEPRVKKKK